MRKLFIQSLMLGAVLAPLGCATTSNTAATEGSASGSTVRTASTSPLTNCPAKEGESLRQRYLRCKATSTQ